MYGGGTKGCVGEGPCMGVEACGGVLINNKVGDGRLSVSRHWLR